MISKKLFLKELNLKNFATFENQEINYSDSFNAIIGETGSGKSLILDSLQLILGAKADKKIIRRDAEFAMVEAIFQSNDPDIKKFFEDLDFPLMGDEIIIKRIIYQNGKSKGQVNHQSATNHILNLFSKRFIDLVGQFENQKLMSEDYQLILLDSFCNNSHTLKDYQELYFKLQAQKKELKELNETQERLREREDYLRFQLNEFNKLNPSVDDEQTLNNQKDAFLNIEKIKTSVCASLDLLSENEQNIIGMLKKVCHLLEADGIQNLETKAQSLKDALQIVEDISYELSGTQSGIQSETQDIENSDENLEEVMNRLDTYQKLKRKFSCDTEGLIVLYQKFSDELEGLSSSEEKIKVLLKKIEQDEKNLLIKASKLHDARVAGAQKLSQELTHKVRELKMEGATLIFKLEKGELGSRGHSKINFVSEMNKGEGFFKVKDIASGGELSRVLLALRQILSSEDSISVFLFDEIDTGIGGETAACIGRALANVAKHSQVIAITHLPQIAAFAEQLVVVNKNIVDVGEEQTRTISHAQEIKGRDARKFVESMAVIH